MNAAADLRIVSDIGGTHARFAVVDARGALSDVVTFACDDHPHFRSALAAYRTRHPQVRHAAIAIANPVDGTDIVAMTNRDWRFSIGEERVAAGLDTLLVINDFAALAHALPHLGERDVVPIGEGAVRSDRTVAVLGAGTGLGVAARVPVGAHGIVMPTEGGHLTYAAETAREAMILAYAREIFPHVSFERLVSGPGLALIHAALAARDGLTQPPLPSPEVVRRALTGECTRCQETVEVFFEMLAAFAGNIALALGAQGGVYLAGGLVPRLLPKLDAGRFRARFEAKGRFVAYLAKIPVRLITTGEAALIGTAAALEGHLTGV